MFRRSWAFSLWLCMIFIPKMCHAWVIRYIVTVGLVKQSSKVYTADGFAYWNDGFRKLQKHERSEQHVAARNALHSLGGMRRIDEALDSSVKSNREAANKMLVNVVRALMFQTCQN